MNKHFSFCISILTFVSLSYASDIHKINRKLVALAPMRMEDYRYHVEPAEAHATEHPVSKLALTMTHYPELNGRPYNRFSITEHAAEKSNGWEAWFVTSPITSAQAVWYDEAGEHIAIRHESSNPYQRVYRVSFMSVLQTLKPEQLSLLRDALWWRDQHDAPSDIQDDGEAIHYSSLPQELKLPVLFRPTFTLRLREIARTILCCRTR